MCGIGAIVSKAQNEAETGEALSKINGLQQHRGPDDSGTFIEGNVGLCHTRLSIIDLSAGGHQPFSSADGDYQLVYNGEVYNFQELRRKLEAKGHLFRSESDTEVVLAAYIEWGTGCFEKFDGMFALVIYDRKRRKLVGARDRMGIKFLHYYKDGSRVVIASEVKSVIGVTGKSSYCRSRLNDILMAGHIEGYHTMFEGVETLPPGSYFEIDIENLEFVQQRYFDMLDRIDPGSYEANRDMPMGKHAEKLEKLLLESMEIHMISDAPLGSLCSGGLDSSLVTAMAQKVNPSIRILHAASKGVVGERRYAEQVAEALGIGIDYVDMDNARFNSLMVDATYHLDAPIYHPNDMSLYIVCEHARDNGLKVLLCGEGADEMFGGYSWQRFFMSKVKMNRAMCSLSNHMKPIRKRWRRNYADYRSNMRLGFSDYMHFAGVFEPYGLDSNAMVSKASSVIWNEAYNLKRWNEIWDRFGFVDDITERAGDAVLADNMSGHLATILHRTDRMGMMASIENRVPFLENEIIDFALNLPVQFKTGGKKFKEVLKHVASDYLPKGIINRTKEGFPVPWGDFVAYRERLFDDGFICNELSIDATLARRICSGDDYMLFRMLAMEIWGRLFVYGQDRDDVKALILE